MNFKKVFGHYSAVMHELNCWNNTVLLFARLFTQDSHYLQHQFENLHACSKMYTNLYTPRQHASNMKNSSVTVVHLAAVCDGFLLLLLLLAVVVMLALICQ